MHGRAPGAQPFPVPAEFREAVHDARALGGLAFTLDGDRAVLLIIRRQPGANIVEVIERVKKLLPELAASISPAIDVKVALDRSTTIRASVADVQSTLLLSVALVVLVVFVFLRSIWATTIPSVAVPLSLIGTFGAMYLLGYSLNNLSLMALTIATGFVVDDAIVVTENVSRYIENGEPPMQAGGHLGQVHPARVDQVGPVRIDHTARDQLGILPFFYTRTDNALIFGSEIKAILEHPAVVREVDRVGLDQVMTLAGLISPRTMFKNIHSLNEQTSP